MKILRKSLIILATLFLAFVLIGIIRPEVNYTIRIAVDKPVDESFRVYHDVSKMRQWLDGFESMKVVKGVPFNVGSEYELVLVMDDKKMVMREILTAYQPNALCAFTLENDVFNSEAEVYFANREGTTEITAMYKIYGKNMLWRSMFALMKGHFQENGQQIYDKLKEVIEKNPS